MPELDSLVSAIRACRICRETPLGSPLPHEPRPVLQPSAVARILVAGQAPGTRVHESGRPFTDPSGDRLRRWMGLAPDQFYDDSVLAIAPMGFCFPGLGASGADLPPRPECAASWRGPLMAAMPQVALVVCLGAYAMRWHMGEHYPGSVDQAVRKWRDGFGLTPKVIPLPHPSWRNNAWLRDNPWFEEEVIPVLQREVLKLLPSRA